MEDILYSLNPWWEGKRLETGIAREKYISAVLSAMRKKKLVMLFGLRRVGKTTIMRQLIERIGKPDHTIYVSMDAYGLWNHSITDILNEFRRIKRLRSSERIYLFADEITYRNGFEHELKTIVDHENVSIVAASSSSLSLRMRSHLLTGRYYPIEVLPLDFMEFLLFRNIKPSRSSMHALLGHFDDYMRIGGMPEYVLTEDPLIPKTIVDDIIVKDVSREMEIDRNTMEDLFILIADRIGKLTSYSKLSRILGVSKTTVSKYISLLEQALMIYEIPSCGKLSERIRMPKKLYIVDHGLRNVITGFRDRGAIFENIVFMRIKDMKPCYPYDLDIDFKIGRKLIDAKYGEKLSKSRQEHDAIGITENEIAREAFGQKLKEWLS